MKQSNLESEMKEMGVNRYWRKVNRTTQGEMETNHPIGRRLLTESVNELAEGIRVWKARVKDRPTGPQHAAYPYIDLLDRHLVAALAARTIIDAISTHSRIVKTAITISRMLEDELKWREISKQDKQIFRHHVEQTKKKRGYESKRRHMNSLERLVDMHFSRWPNPVRVKVGIVLIELMKQHTGLIDIETRTGLMGKRDTFVRPTDQLLSWMKMAHKSSEDLSPIYLPMVVRPKNWTTIWDGGYLTDQIHRRPLIKTSDRKHLAEVGSVVLDEPLEAVNALQSVGWRVNKRLYSCMKYFWEQGVAAGGLPSTEGEPIPSKPVDIDTNAESRRKWRKLAARIHYENEAEDSRRIQVAQVLWMAEKFQDEKLFMPWYMDFRGRMYPRPYGLQPQGADWSRSLLQFADGEQMTESGVNWLAIHGANCYGMDKLSFTDRREWVWTKDEWLRSIAKDPEGSLTEWGKADEPWAFLSFCLEWAEYRTKGSDMITHLPCSIDGSSNGLQILSLVMRDPVGAESTNVIMSEDGKPQDIYQNVADATVARLKESTHPFASKWIEFGIDRFCTKRPTMVVPYSGTLFAVTDYTIAWFREQMKKKGCENPFGWEEVYPPCAFLAKVIWEALGDIVGEARRAMTWFQECSDICISNNTPIRWTTPTGFLVKQAYETWQNSTIKTIIGDVIRRHKINVGSGNLSKIKNRNAIAPNWVHSLDAAVAQKSILECKVRGVSDVNIIHDAFWTTSPNMEVMRSSLTNSVIDIFSEDLLHSFRKELTAYLPGGESLPEPPSIGTLDIDKVRESIYFFS